MTTYRGSYFDTTVGAITWLGFAGNFRMTTEMALNFDDVRLIDDDTVGAVLSGSGSYTISVSVDYEPLGSYQYPLDIAPAEITFSLSRPDALLPEFGAEAGYLGSNDIRFDDLLPFIVNGDQLLRGGTTLTISGAGDYSWTDGTVYMVGRSESDGRLPLVTALATVRENYGYITEHEAATSGVAFEVERLDTALEPAVLDWWVTGDTYFDYVDHYGPQYRQMPVYLDDFVDQAIPRGTVSFAAGEKVKTVTVFFADDDRAEYTERAQLNVALDGSGLFKVRSAGTVAIQDDDPKPTLDIVALQPEQAEGTGGTTRFEFDVVRSGNLSGTVSAIWSVAFRPQGGIRYPDPGDFAGGAIPMGLVELPDGEERVRITVEVAADAVGERDEVFDVALWPQLVDQFSGQYVIYARSTILDDDPIDDLLVTGTDGLSRPAVPARYSGPMADLEKECILLTEESLVVRAAGPGWFIHTGSGNDAIALQGGRNIVDGGSGSNFIAMAGGVDTVFMDTRGAVAESWSTVVGLAAGDMTTLWGLTTSKAELTWVDGWGAEGYTGLTLVARNPGAPAAALTLAGVTQSDKDNGRVLFASAQDIFGNDYLNVWLRS